MVLLLALLLVAHFGCTQQQQQQAFPQGYPVETDAFQESLRQLPPEDRDLFGTMYGMIDGVMKKQDEQELEQQLYDYKKKLEKLREAELDFKAIDILDDRLDKLGYPVNQQVNDKIQNISPPVKGADPPSDLNRISNLTPILSKTVYNDGFLPSANDEDLT